MEPKPRQPEHEILTTLERWGEGIIVFCLFALFSFFYAHQEANTGFFTSRFGPLEKLALYGPIFAAVVAPLVKITVGRKNPARPFEAAASLLLALGSLRLINVFPFEFAHFSDIFPAGVRFMFAWFTNNLALIPLYLQVIIGPLTAIGKLWKYFVVRMRGPADQNLRPTT